MRARRIGVAVVLAAIAALLAAGVAATRTGSPPSASASKPLIVLVTDTNQLNDHGFNHLAYMGLLQAEKKLGIQGVVYQSVSSQDYIPNLATGAEKGAALVISVGFDQ